MEKGGYEHVSSDDTLAEKDLIQPFHRRTCCPYHLHANEEFSWLLWCDFPRALLSIALLVMAFWEALTPVVSTMIWFILLLIFALFNLVLLLAASALSGLWFQKGKSIAHLFAPYIEYIIVQFLGSVVFTSLAGYIYWGLCSASPLSVDTTFSACSLTTPLKYRSYSTWNVGLAVFLGTQIVGLGQLFRVYLTASITRTKR